MVKWLHYNCTEGCTTFAVDGAAAGGHLDVIKFLIENRTEAGQLITYEFERDMSRS